MVGIDAGNVGGGNVLDLFKRVIVLTDGADGDAEAVVEDADGDEDIDRVGFLGNRIVAVGDSPATKGDVVCVDRISVISVDNYDSY